MTQKAYNNNEPEKTLMTIQPAMSQCYFSSIKLLQHAEKDIYRVVQSFIGQMLMINIMTHVMSTD